MRSVASLRRRSRRAPGCERRSRLRVLHLLHGRKPTAETTMSDEVTGRASDGDTAANEQPYDWDKCTVRLSITFLPGDGDEGGRQIIVGCNTHRDPPLVETVREAGMGSLPPVIAGLLEGLKRRLPQRAEMAESRRRAEEEEAERLKLQQQQAKEKIQAARQRALAKNDRHR